MTEFDSWGDRAGCSGSAGAMGAAVHTAVGVSLVGVNSNDGTMSSTAVEDEAGARKDEGRGSKKRKRLRVVRRRVGAALLPILAPLVLRTLAWTWRKADLHGERFEECNKEKGFIISLWHGRMLLGLHRFEGASITVLISPSDDGSLVNSLVTRLGNKAVRGSSNKNAARALRELLTLLKQGRVVAITPDGPRGPCYSVNSGLVWLARATGYPILPLGLVTDNAWRLKSWDGFTIPKLFSKVRVVFGEPMRVEKGGGERALEDACELLKARMDEAEREGLADLGLDFQAQ